MTTTQNDFVQPAETVHLGSSPRKGVFYVWHSGGVASQYCVATGEQMKNGKHIVYMHDVFCGPRKKVVRVGMDSQWFAQWKRAEVVPGRVHALLSAELSK